ncbi:hypothetical protein P879_09677 [Paragonimus westermani]|uniref:Uncharacterized protein n=1 Tax=Paragonimus westermani TaxID=34504 RepID=A0A8T0DKW9_9TREM|nr:hypothetical protein P879_09677 [Paragonimus westermani]
MKRLLIWILLLALQNLPAVVLNYDNFFLGFDVELPPQTYMCSEKDRLIRDHLNPFSRSCTHLDGKTLPRLLDPSVIETQLEWGSNPRSAPPDSPAYFVKYFVKDTKEVLEETPTVQLHNPEIKPLVLTVDNAVYVNSHLVGHFYILLLDAFQPKFLRFQAPGESTD